VSALFHRKLLALAAPRSGTRYVKTALRGAGVKVGHESFKADGTVGMFFAVEDCAYPGKHWCTEDESRQRRSDYTFDQTWHFVRDPRKAIASMASSVLSQLVWFWQERHTGISAGIYPKKLRAMKFWVAWNEIIEACHPDFFFRVEEMSAVWPEICDRLDLPGATGFPSIPRDYGTVKPGERLFPDVSWDEMKSLDAQTFRAVKRMAERYGYETE